MENEKPVNPYQAPAVATLTAAPENDPHSFIPGGRTVSVGNCWSWISAAWKLFAASPLIWIVNFVLFFIINFIIGLIPFGSLVGIVLGPVWMAGFLYGSHAVHGGRALEVGDLFAGFREKTGPLLGLGLLTLGLWIVLFIIAAILFVAVLDNSGFFTAILSQNPEAIREVINEEAGLSFLLFFLIIMALAIPIMMAAWFAPALVLFHDVSPIAAMSMSFKGCLRNVIPFLLYGIITFILLILAMIPLLLGLFVVVPMLYIAIYTSYRDIFTASDH